jgi:hypothetical protein
LHQYSNGAGRTEIIFAKNGQWDRTIELIGGSGGDRSTTRGIHVITSTQYRSIVVDKKWIYIFDGGSHELILPRSRF